MFGPQVEFSTAWDLLCKCLIIQDVSPFVPVNRLVSSHVMDVYIMVKSTVPTHGIQLMTDVTNVCVTTSTSFIVLLMYANEV